MKTIEIEYALTEKFFADHELVATGITKNNGIISHECDLLTVNKNMYITEYEIKVSLSDIKADLKKEHNHDCDKIARTFFVLPLELVDKAIEFIPEKFGIIGIEKVELLVDCKKRMYEHGYRLRYKRQPKRNNKAKRITEKELLELYRLDNMRKARYLKEVLKEKCIIEKFKGE